MKQLVFVVLSLFFLLPTADALECIAIKTAAINSANGDCAYFDTVCAVPSGWRTVSYCPDDDIQFFRLSKYLPNLAMLLGSFVGFFVLTVVLRRLLFSLGQKSEEADSEPKPSFMNRIASLFVSIKNSISSVTAFFSSFALKKKMKSAFSQEDHRTLYRRDIQAVSEVVHSTAKPVPTEKSVELPPLQESPKKETQGTDWDEFKKTLKKLDSLEKKKG